MIGKKTVLEKKNIFFLFFAFTLHIQKKLAQGLTLQYDDNFYSYNDRLNLSEIFFKNLGLTQSLVNY